jgi:cobalt/nickel transport system permease protein
MRRIALDSYVDRASVIHRLPALVKLVMALLVVIGMALAPRGEGIVFVTFSAVLLCMILLARVPLLNFGLRILLFEPFVIGVALLSLLQPHGLPIFLALVTKSTLCLATMTLLTATTPFTDILGALRALRVPALLITTLALMYRYLFLLVDELERMQRARASRSFSRRRFSAWYLLSTMIAQLFVRASLRAERIYSAMCSRGWEA